jgi:putative iron-dependent peroxidase
MHPQPGIFALGVPEHCYLEFDLETGAEPARLVELLAGISGPETTIAGVSAVVGFRPEMWAELRPDTPGSAASFRPVEGADVTFPATQHDAWLWIAGGSRDVVFDNALWVIHALEGVATVATEVNGWLYQHKRDLTGFIDGTENPQMVDAVDVAAADDGTSVLLYQQWRHLPGFARLSTEEQEKVIGRTKADSTELDDDVMPADSHVSRNVVEEDGRELRIYRRNTAYGGPTDHGTVFVGFCAEARPLQVMLERMAGRGDGVRDALTRYTTALTGAYYVVPSVEALRSFLPEED